MIKINQITTNEMLRNSDCDILIHKGSFDRTHEILKNKRITWRDFASFSDGFPLLPVHGDSIIVFDKNKLVEKGHHFLKIKYDSGSLKRNKDILMHLMEGKNEEEFLRKNVHDMITEYKLKLEAAMKHPLLEGNVKSEELDELKGAEQRIKSNPMAYFLEMFKGEKEVISASPFDFDAEDVMHVISNSLMQKYYGIPEEFKDRFLFLEDYCPPQAKIYLKSPLLSWIEEKVLELKKSDSYPIDGDVFVALHTLNGIILHPEWEGYVIPVPRLEIKIPDRWDRIMRNMHEYPNDELKAAVIDYIFRVYILHKFAPQIDYEDDLYKRILG